MSYHVCANCPDSLDDCYPDTSDSCDMKARNHPDLVQIRVTKLHEPPQVPTRFSLLEVD